MKKLFSLLVLMLFAFNAEAQIVNGFDLKKVSPEKRKELLSSLTTSEKRALIREYRYGILIGELNIEGVDKQTAFKKIFDEYQMEQRKIKDTFNPSFEAEKLSDDEAVSKLEQSFVVGEKLMESRRKYAKELQKVLSPQQILKLFQNEGALREKMMGNRPPSSPSRPK